MSKCAMVLLETENLVQWFWEIWTADADADTNALPILMHYLCVLPSCPWFLKTDFSIMLCTFPQHSIYKIQAWNDILLNIQWYKSLIKNLSLKTRDMMVIRINNALELAIHLCLRQHQPFNFLKTIEPSFQFLRGPWHILTSK